MKTTKEQIETLPEVQIDCTPTWESLVLLYAEKATNGNADAQSELARMAGLADSVKPLRAERDGLLAALEFIASVLSGHSKPTTSKLNEMQRAARAAILKAKGEK